jgi:hypothetical protein
MLTALYIGCFLMLNKANKNILPVYFLKGDLGEEFF